MEITPLDSPRHSRYLVWFDCQRLKLVSHRPFFLNGYEDKLSLHQADLTFGRGGRGEQLPRGENGEREAYLILRLQFMGRSKV